MGNSIVRAAALITVPWVDGGGVTRIIADLPQWRLSLATIAGAGPFSLFPGMVRHFALVAGQVILRRVDGTILAKLDAQSPPLVFAGDDRVYASPGDGPALALNLMVPVNAPRLRLERWHDGHLPDAVAIFACAPMRIDGAMLKPHDTLFSAGPVCLAGPALVVR